MYEYKYVSVDYESGFNKVELVNHQEVISRNAEDGWRFVEYIPTKIVGYGMVSRIDLVFEREI